MNQVGLDQQWLYFLRQYIRPMQEKLFTGYIHDVSAALAGDLKERELPGHLFQLLIDWTIIFCFFCIWLSTTAPTSFDELCGTVPSEWAGQPAPPSRFIDVHHKHCPESSKHRLPGRWLSLPPLQLLNDQSTTRLVAHSPGTPDALPRGSHCHPWNSLHNGFICRPLNSSHPILVSFSSLLQCCSCLPLLSELDRIRRQACRSILFCYSYSQTAAVTPILQLLTLTTNKSKCIYYNY